MDLVRLEAEILELRPGILDVDAQAAVLTRTSATFRREGEYWSMAFDGDAFRLRDSKGVATSRSSRRGSRDPFLELVSAVEGYAPPQMPSDTELRPGAGDAGQILDARAKAEYASVVRARVRARRGRGVARPERASRLRQEIDFLASELGAAVGLGGRDRAASDAERARVNVTRAIRATMERIAAHSASLSRHLAATVRTGTFCSYQPDPRVPVTWSS